MQRLKPFSRPVIRVMVSVAVVAAALSVSAAQAHDDALQLRAFGTAVIDGVANPGEWDGAAKWDFAANLPPSGTTPATLYAMNDGAHIYLGVKVARPTLSSGGVSFWFDNDHDASYYEEGDDALMLNTGFSGYVDGFVTKQSPCPPTYTCLGIRDTQLGGTSDGSGTVRNDGTHSFYELSHPLDTSDDGHDFSLRFGKRVGFQMFVNFCSSTCAQTFSPALGDIVVTSGSTLAPETQITEGPRNGSFSVDISGTLGFTGSDDAIAPEDLTYECSVRGGAFEPCESPFDYVLDDDGTQSIGVRATDEAGNVDPTPATRGWTVDTEAPAAPSVRGPRRLKRARVAFRLAAMDNVDRPSQLRFRCALDRRGFKRCPRRLTLRVRPGRHTLRVMAVDRTGHVSKRTIARFVRVKSR